MSLEMKVQVKMNWTTTSFKSRWGYHPCDFNLFLKLKTLHRWYWQTVYDFHRWHRWSRKEPQNRVGLDPPVCVAFLEDRVWHKPIERRGVRGYKIYPKTVTDHGIVDLYQQARMPQSTPTAPLDEETRGKIDELYDEAASFFVT